MKNILALILSLSIVVVSAAPLIAQDPALQQPTADDLAKQKAELEKNAYRLLDQVIDEGQSLRLPENRVRLQINGADLLWDHNQERARSLFAMASDTVSEMARSTNTNANTPGQGPLRNFPQPNRGAFALRQELVLAAARHDAALAYQLLAATKAPTPTPTPTPTTNQPTDPRNARQQFNADDNLEQTLLGRIAALDPKMAAQNAEQMMDKGQFPRTLGEVINQLTRQDADAGAKLADKTVKKIQAANLLSNNEAGNLAQSLISAGPRMPASATPSPSPNATPQQSSGRGPVLDVSAYTDLLSTIIDAALKATPQAQNNQRPNAGGRGGPNANRIIVTNGQTVQASQQTTDQIEQNNARRLLAGLQSALPSIDQYLPGRAGAVRQKLTELGLSDPSRTNFIQAMSSLQQGNATSESLEQAAAAAPAQLQPRLYQQAASRAIEEGNTDRARQIANDHLQSNARDSIMQRIDFKELAKKADTTRLDEIRQNVARLTSDSDKVTLLLQIANDLQKDNPKVQLQILEEAKQVVGHRATNYDQFENQVRVARAFSTVDAARSFEVLEPGISQLNELLSAAQVLSGFEVNIFRDGEMAVTNQFGSGLSSTISSYGQELSRLAKIDFGRSEMLAGRFQFTEPRIMVRLAIVQGALGTQPQPNAPGLPNVNVFRNFEDFVVVSPE
jgi:hypothetical protein